MITDTKLKEVDYFKAWAFFWLLSTVGGVMIGAFGGAVLGFVLGGVGVRMHTIKILCGVLGFVLGIPISYLLFQLSVRKLLLPKLSPPPNSTPPIPVV
jgi:hypothetical protein